MLKRPALGISDFKELREENRYFVDKSLFIKDIIEDSAKVILLPRPRRFGKTLNISMLRRFFENIYKKDVKKLFADLYIEKEPIFNKHIGQYPVIFLTFKDIKFQEFSASSNAIKQIIAEEYRRHKYLLKSSALDKIEKKEFSEIMSLNVKDSMFAFSLKYLSKYLFNHFKQKPVILIDEYDTPIHTAYENGYYDKCISFFKSFLGAALKDNDYIFKGVLTGILRVARESIFSELNNLGVYSILREEFADFFGFTENEVLEMLTYYGLQSKFDEVKSWYDGYVFGKSKIYNPWSIINLIASKDKRCRLYWVNTSSNEFISKLMKESPNNVKRDLEDLLKDIPVIKSLNENIVLQNLKNDENAIYSLLVLSGYLKAYDGVLNKQDNKVYYKLLPVNAEVKQIFRDMITLWMKESYESGKLNLMLSAVVEGDAKTFEKILSGFVLETLSYFDTNKKDVEKVYQAFILGMLVNLSDRYEVISEKESGFGRYDISIIPKDSGKKAVIMELKTIDKFENETKDKALENALKQIDEKKYETDIIKRGTTDIIKMGVVFDGKRVWVKTR